MSNNNHIFILAGERSGDIHGGMLMESITKIDNSITFSGIGGTSMESAGLQSLFPIDKMAIVGFVEVIKHLNFFKDVELQVLSIIKKNNPDRIILIDFPGFNLRIAKKIKNLYNIPITYYISPQIWAWKENRIKTIKKYIDQMLVILPFEKGWYANRGMDVEWVGHPYLDHSQSNLSKQELKLDYGIEPSKLLLTLFPGSRQIEVDRHMPLLLKACRKILKNNDIHIAIGLAPGVKINNIDDEVAIVESEDPHKLLQASDLLITASGTATLEAAILGVPMAVIYKLNIISWILSKLMIKINFIALPNIILSKPVIPEFIQSHARADDIVEYMQKLIDSPNFREQTSIDLKKIIEVLGEKGASDRAAQKILQELS